MVETESSCVTTTETNLDEMRAKLAEQPDSLYAILDSYGEPRVLAKVEELGEQAVCLYRGRAFDKYWNIAPYLVKIDEVLLDWVVEELWDSPWGVFVWASVDLDKVRRHFRKFLLVLSPEGKKLYFRFYDPLVLPTFLMSCNAEEAKHFCSCIECFIVKKESGDMQNFFLTNNIQ